MYEAEVRQDISFVFLDNASRTDPLGEYSPCFSLSSVADGEESGSFGSLYTEHGGVGATFSCEFPMAPYNGGFVLPFRFGQVQTQLLTLDAQAGDSVWGEAYASFANGYGVPPVEHFVLYDEFGNMLPPGTWSVEVVPESGEIPAFGTAVALVLFELRRRCRTPPARRTFRTAHPSPTPCVRPAGHAR